LPLGKRTLLMAIVNLTEDSFSGDGLATADFDNAVRVAVDRLDSGADILDLGAESTRPGAKPLSADAEQARVLPVLEAVMRERPAAILSVDTYHASTARAAATAGAQIINDVSGMLWDEDMAKAVAETRCGVVLMHTRGKPTEWGSQPALEMKKVVPLVAEGLRERLAVAHAAGIAKGSIVVDPGFGFGKVGEENFALLAGFAKLGKVGYPVLAGLSRKGFLGEALADLRFDGHAASEDRVNATIAANVAAILAGAHIVRVHDLQEARESAGIADAILAS